jgi:hypothetical protein
LAKGATTAGAEDSRGREALVRYVLRPPIAQERLHILPDNLVRIELKRPFRDGTVAIDLDPLSLLCRLAASVPPPGFHLVHYAGILGAASKLRPLVVPPLPIDSLSAASHSHREHPPTHRSRYRPWAELLKRTFQIDVERCECGDGPTHFGALGEAEVRPVRHVRRDLAVFDAGSLTNRGLRSVLAFNANGSVQLGCNEPSNQIRHPPACPPYAPGRVVCW